MKKIIPITAAVLLGILLWYLFIKPYDYLVTFKASTSPGTINQTIKAWGSDLDNASVIGQEDLNRLEQQIEFNDSIFLYKWNISSLNDSTSKVKVYVKDLNNSFNNKLKIPFGSTDFEKRTKKTLVDFHKKLDQHLAAFKVTIVGEDQIEPTYCAYVPLKRKQTEKAGGMMQYYSFLSSMILENNIETNGPPFIQIMDWNRKNDSITYHFCFPIIKNDSLPEHKSLKYKPFNGTKGLKAIYNGNYITSDRAWYALIDHAEKNNIEIVKKPVEVFYSNPNFGGNELNWKAEVFMPLK